MPQAVQPAATAAAATAAAGRDALHSVRKRHRKLAPSGRHHQPGWEDAHMEELSFLAVLGLGLYLSRCESETRPCLFSFLFVVPSLSCASDCTQHKRFIAVLSGGKGTIVIKDSATGATLLSTPIPLTPGPLVVVLKDSYPPKSATNIETIAASFVPPAGNGSAARLVNLAMDVPSAGLTYDGGLPLADNVAYTLGSTWSAVPAGQQNFSAYMDGASGSAPLASAPFTPPSAPQVFTTFLLGTKSFGYSLLPQVDAPETGKQASFTRNRYHILRTQTPTAIDWSHAVLSRFQSRIEHLVFLELARYAVRLVVQTNTASDLRRAVPTPVADSSVYTVG